MFLHLYNPQQNIMRPNDKVVCFMTRGHVTCRETQDVGDGGEKSETAGMKSIRTPPQGQKFSPHCHQDQEAPSRPHHPPHPARDLHPQSIQESQGQPLTVIPSTSADVGE